jgi:hypothetical protein
MVQYLGLELVIRDPDVPVYDRLGFDDFVILP